MRQEGYYWIKRMSGDIWTVGKYLGHDDWFVVGEEYFVYEKDIFEINETRILNPDE